MKKIAFVAALILVISAVNTRPNNQEVWTVTAPAGSVFEPYDPNNPVGDRSILVDKNGTAYQTGARVDQNGLIILMKNPKGNQNTLMVLVKDEVDCAIYLIEPNSTMKVDVWNSAIFGLNWLPVEEAQRFGRETQFILSQPDSHCRSPRVFGLH